MEKAGAAQLLSVPALGGLFVVSGRDDTVQVWDRNLRHAYTVDVGSAPPPPRIGPDGEATAAGLAGKLGAFVNEQRRGSARL